MKKMLFAFALLGITSSPAMAQDTTPPPVEPVAPAAAPAAAPVAPAATGLFGSVGQLVISDDAYVDLTSQHSVEGSDSSNTSLQLRLAADYFTAPNISVGGVLGFARPMSGWSEFALGARAGYNLALAPNLSFWPRLQLLFSRVSLDVAGTSASANVLTLSVSAPLLYHPVEHFFLGLGPVVNLELAHSDYTNKPWSIGLTSVIGGYFNL